LATIVATTGACPSIRFGNEIVALASLARRTSDLNWADSEIECNAASGVKGAIAVQMGYSDRPLLVAGELEAAVVAERLAGPEVETAAAPRANV
jgi:hypothetical protein